MSIERLSHPYTKSDWISWLTSGTPRREPCESRKFCRRHQLLLHNFYCKCMTSRCLILKMKIKVMEHNIHNGAVLWQISKSIKDITYFLALTFTNSEMLTFQIFDHENVRQYRKVQYSQWCQSMANANVYKCHSMDIYASAHRRYINVSTVWRWSFRTKSPRVQHSLWSQSAANINSYNCHSTHFYAFLRLLKSFTI